MIIVDAHVHIYDCFDVDYLLDSALANFRAAAARNGAHTGLCSCFLLLAESRSCSWFERVTDAAGDGQSARGKSANWSFSLSAEKGSLAAARKTSPNDIMHIVAGRQVVTSEKIEVLGLFDNRFVGDGLPLSETVSAIRSNDGLAVLPWGVGKWFGRRGKIIKNYIGQHRNSDLFLGDNGGRPVFWPTPLLFDVARQRDILVLPGSDPLPVPREAGRTGSYGFYIHQDMQSSATPARDLKNIIRSRDKEIHPFGRLQKSLTFLMNQVQMRCSM